MTALQPADPLLGLPTAPGRLPLLGHALAIAWDLQGLMRRVADHHGPLCWVEIGPGNRALLYTRTASFELFKNKLTGNQHYQRAASNIVGHSVIVVDGDEHRRMRGAMNKPFTPTGLNAAGVSVILREVIGQRTPRMAAASSIHLLHETQTLALDVIFRVLGIGERELEPWRQAYDRLLVGGLGVKLDFPGSPARRAREARAWLDIQLREHIARARQDPEAGGLLAELARGQDEQGRGLSDEELLDNVLVLALAGHETTASAMAWMMSYLATQPALAEAVFAEVRASPQIPATPADLARFPQVEALFREVLRLYPPAAFLTREVTGDLVLEGVAIPRGTQLMLPVWLMGRDPELYPEPESFKPERWLGRERKPTPLETASFGGGPHFCLGYHMAWMEAVQFTVGFVLALEQNQRRLHMDRLPRVSSVPLLRPRARDCVARVIPTV